MTCEAHLLVVGRRVTLDARKRDTTTKATVAEGLVAERPRLSARRRYVPGPHAESASEMLNVTAYTAAAVVVVFSAANSGLDNSAVLSKKGEPMIDRDWDGDCVGVCVVVADVEAVELTDALDETDCESERLCVCVKLGVVVAEPVCERVAAAREGCGRKKKSVSQTVATLGQGGEARGPA